MTQENVMDNWSETRMTLLYDVLRAAQDLINYKCPNLPQEWRRHEEAWTSLEAAVKRVVNHSESLRDQNTGC